MPLPDLVYFNDKIIPLKECFISPYDHGLTTGDGFFETIILEKGVPFALEDHYLRLVHSAKCMDLPYPQWENLRDGIKALLEKTGFNKKDGRLRITITAGICSLGSERPNDLQETILVTVADLPYIPKTETLITVPYRRNEFGALKGIKTVSYGENVLAFAYAKQKGGGEALFLNTKGELCEGTGSNLFLVKDEKVFTPNLEGGCLGGVTREIVIFLCKEAGISVSEEPICANRLKDFTEVFMTSTLRRIQVVERIDNWKLPALKEESLTAKINDLFLNLLRSGKKSGIPEKINVSF